jgi:hypothetical protein
VGVRQPVSWAWSQAYSMGQIEVCLQGRAGHGRKQAPELA